VWKIKQLGYLRTYIKKIDPQLSHSNDYLQAAIEFLIKKEDYEELYHFQVMRCDIVNRVDFDWRLSFGWRLVSDPI
jgi:hypothetical protein